MLGRPATAAVVADHDASTRSAVEAVRANSGSVDEHEVVVEPLHGRHAGGRPPGNHQPPQRLNQLRLEVLGRLDWSHASVDSASIRAKRGGTTWRKPVDRGKPGSKLQLACEGAGSR